MKICIVNLYFGRVPDYFDLFLLSCSKNKKIDFLFFVDFDVTFDVPTNVTFVSSTFSEIIKLFQSHFDFNIALNFPYKLTDFQPSIGDVFKDYLKEYDWWGHCDFDMIFGDLTQVLELVNQSSYDKILRQGHLTLYKNTATINQVYRRDFSNEDVVKNQNGLDIHRAYPHDGKYMSHENVLSSDGIYAFDEFWGIDRLFYILNLSVYREPIMADISYKSMFLKMTAHPNFFGQYFVWRDGILMRRSLLEKNNTTDSYPYIHLQKRKLAQHYASLNSDTVVVINQFGFFDCTKWHNYHYFFTVLSCIPNFAQKYRYYVPRLIKRLTIYKFNYK